MPVKTLAILEGRTPCISTPLVKRIKYLTSHITFDETPLVQTGAGLTVGICGVRDQVPFELLAVALPQS